MKKILTYVLASLCLAFSVSSCWEDEVVPAGPGRHQVNDLVAVAGDEEVTLTWSLPEGWDATDFIIIYNDENSNKVTLNVGNVKTYTITGLKNDVLYNFSVQAVYGKLISGQMTASATPKTTRIAVRDLAAEAGNGRTSLSWTKPSDTLIDYTLTYYKDGDEASAKTVTIPANATSYEVTGLENDFNYVFVLVANYEKGASDKATVKALPSSATVFFLSQETAALNQPITFSFNTKDFPTATDITWSFPDGTVLKGAEVSSGISSTGVQKVQLAAKVDGVQKNWTVEVTIREYVVNYTDFGSNGAGFKSNVPVFSPDHKTVYSLTYNTNATLFAWDVVTGELKWKYEMTGQKGYNSATVNPVTGDIYFGTTTAGNFCCLNPDGTLKWKFTGAGSMQSASPTTNADGSVVYILDNPGNAFAINASTGTQIWKVAMGKQGGGILVNGDEILFGMNTGGRATLVWVNASDGTDIATLSQTTGMTEMSGFAVSADKKYAYYSNKGGYISKVDLVERKLVVDALSIASADVYEPCVSPNGDVFIGSKNSHAYCLDGDLKDVKWTLSIPDLAEGTNNGFNYSHPCVDTDGNFYISSGQIQCWNFILYPNGSTKESWQYGSSSTDRVMAGTNLCDGVYYVPMFNSGNAASAFIGKYVGGTRYDGHGTDLCGNCIVK